MWKFWSLIMGVVSLVACGGGPSGQDLEPDLHPIDRLIAGSFGAEDEPGLALMAVKDGEVAFQRTHGIANMNTGEKITPQSNFRLASVTKQMTALAALMLSDRGDLDLNAPLTNFFQGFPSYGKDITPRMLIHHTSGLVEYESLIVTPHILSH